MQECKHEQVDPDLTKGECIFNIAWCLECGAIKILVADNNTDWILPFHEEARRKLNEINSNIAKRKDDNHHIISGNKEQHTNDS